LLSLVYKLPLPTASRAGGRGGRVLAPSENPVRMQVSGPATDGAAADTENSAEPSPNFVLS